MLKFSGCSCLISDEDWRWRFVIHLCRWSRGSDEITLICDHFVRGKHLMNSFSTRECDLNRIKMYDVNLTHWNKHGQRISSDRGMRSKIWWLAEFCNSHCVSHFAAFFIVMGTKISIVENFRFLFLNNLVISFWILCLRHIPRRHAKRTKVRFKIVLMILPQVHLRKPCYDFSFL
jgi:hypothetical protein